MSQVESTGRFAASSASSRWLAFDIASLAKRHGLELPREPEMPKNDAERESQLRKLASKLFFTLEKQGLQFGLYRDVDVSKPVRHDGLSLDEVETYLILGSFAVRTVGEPSGRKRTNHRLASSVVNLKERNKDGPAQQADQLINSCMNNLSRVHALLVTKNCTKGKRFHRIGGSVSPSTFSAVRHYLRSEA
jgi:hypothetical protein